MELIFQITELNCSVVTPRLLQKLRHTVKPSILKILLEMRHKFMYNTKMPEPLFKKGVKTDSKIHRPISFLLLVLTILKKECIFKL